jgi:hypothetical protein
MMENIYTIKCQKKISVTIFILDKVPQNEEWYHEGYFIAIKKLIHQGHVINSVYTPAMYWIVTPPPKVHMLKSCTHLCDNTDQGL